MTFFAIPILTTLTFLNSRSLKFTMMKLQMIQVLTTIVKEARIKVQKML